MGGYAQASRRPRARAVGPLGQGIRWDRLGRVFLLGLLLAILMLYVSPLERWLTQSQTAARDAKELRQLQRDNARLKARVRALHQPATLERRARELGMIRQGERAFVIETPSGR
jgi:cell division protein FtsB